MKDYFESRRDELVKLVSDLVAVDTVNPPGNEYRAVEVVEKYIGPLGIVSTRHEKAKGRTNLVARIGSGSPSIVIVGHVDTVPAGDDWETDPFTAIEKDGRLYGRGTMDDKGQTASMFLAGRYLKEHEAELNGEVILVAVADEERGSEMGMQYLLDEGIVSADYAIIPDASSDLKTVYIAEKAALFMQLTSFGKQAHGSRPQGGVNAITNVMEVIRRIGEMQFDVTEHALLSPPTFNLGKIEGGIAPNVVPAKCVADLDMRFLPGDSRDAIVDKINAICRGVENDIPGARFELAVKMSDEPIELPESHPLIRAIIEETEAVLGFRPECGGMSGSTVAKFTMKRGIPSVNFAPGDGDVAHMSNEWVSIDALVSFAHVLTRIVMRLLNGESNAAE